MADNQSTVALNIGSQRVAMGHFSPAKGGKLVLNKYASTSILADPANDSTRIPQLQVALSQLSNGLKLSKEKARYSISGQSAITRFVKLPPLDDDNVEQIVAFEAQQVVPFPLDQVIWDYQMVDSPGIEQEVAIVAIKADQLNEINDAVHNSGLGTAEVDISPLALYNALKYNYPNLDGCTLLLDIGAKSSNLIYVEGDKFFLRSVNVGGASITASISKEYGIDFTQAEAQKVSNGMVALGGGHTEQMDENTAALAMTIRNALSKLPAEVSRTNNLFRSQHGGSAPARILIAGGGANLPYTKEFLEEKLNTTIEVFNPLQRVSLGKSVDKEIVASEAHMMGELVGLAVRPIGKAAVKIDLVPSSVELDRAEYKRRPLLLTGVGLFLASLAAFGFFKKSQADEAVQRAEELKQDTEVASRPQQQIKKLETREKALDAKMKAIHDAETSRTRWINILNTLSEAFAHDAVWIADMSPLAGYDPLNPNAEYPVVNPTYARMGYGLDATQKLRDGIEPEINAISVYGFWRQTEAEKEASFQQVYQLIKKLRETGADVFDFTADNNGDTVELTDKQIIQKLTTAVPPGSEAYAYDFKLVLPLKEGIPAGK